MTNTDETLLLKGDFQGFLASIRAKTQIKIDAIGDVSNGAILSNQEGTRWVFLLPDMTEQGKWRLQRFDADGFSGHAIYDSHASLVEAAARENFITHDHGALDRLQDTPRFQRGNFASDLIRRVNSRDLSHDQADRLLAEYDAQPV